MYPLDRLADGTMALHEIEAAVRGDDIHFPRTSLICLENTADGLPLTADYTQRVGEIARRRGLQLHLDGARLFNAVAALNVAPKDLAAPADSIQICLSKGLCAPLGALLVGTKDFIKLARRTRKVLGGGMRQTGIAAAAGMIALRDMRERLIEDHRNAARLAAGLSEIDGITVAPAELRTNMVFFSIPATVDNAAFVAAMRAQNVILRGGPNFRAVLHYWITPERVDTVLAAVRRCVARASRP
jgi:threonine aldolase